MKKVTDKGLLPNFEEVPSIISKARLELKDIGIKSINDPNK